MGNRQYSLRPPYARDKIPSGLPVIPSITSRRSDLVVDAWQNAIAHSCDFSSNVSPLKLRPTHSSGVVPPYLSIFCTTPASSKAGVECMVESRPILT
jgi:hypothetical protein